MSHPNDKPFSLNECVDACMNKEGCQFFISGINDKAGECWMEKTTNEFCPEGFEKDDYNFYMIKSKKWGADYQIKLFLLTNNSIHNSN